MSNQILPNPPEPTVGGEGIAMNPQSPSVNVFMPFNLTVDELEAELFGQSVDMSGILIKVNRPIPANVLYSGTNGWLKYLQKDDEDSFEGYVNSDMATGVIDEIKSSLYLTEGESYDPTNKGTENLDASGVFPDVGSATWQNYHNIQDIVLAIFAHKILGHPGALSIISNDSSIRATVSQTYEDTLEKIKGAENRGIGGDDTEEDLDNIAGNGVTGGLDQTGLHMILQQFMNQAPDRFTTGDRGTLRPLEWKDGDKFYIQMHMFNNKYQIKSGAPANHPVLLNGDYTNVIAPIGAPGISMSDGYYILEFTVGESSGPGPGPGPGPSFPSSPITLTGPVTVPTSINTTTTYTFINSSASPLTVSLYTGGTVSTTIGPIAPNASANAPSATFTGYTAAVSGPAFDIVMINPTTPNAYNAVLSSSSIITGYGYSNAIFTSAQTFGGSSIKLSWTMPAYTSPNGRLFVGIRDYNANNYAELAFDHMSGTSRFIVNTNGDVTFTPTVNVETTYSITFNTTTGYATAINETTNTSIGTRYVGTGTNYKFYINTNNFTIGPNDNESITITNIGATYA
jgi:hypothetical protein